MFTPNQLAWLRGKRDASPSHFGYEFDPLNRLKECVSSNDNPDSNHEAELDKICALARKMEPIDGVKRDETVGRMDRCQKVMSRLMEHNVAVEDVNHVYSLLKAYESIYCSMSLTHSVCAEHTKQPEGQICAEEQKNLAEQIQKLDETDPRVVDDGTRNKKSAGKTEFLSERLQNMREFSREIIIDTCKGLYNPKYDSTVESPNIRQNLEQSLDSDCSNTEPESKPKGKERKKKVGPKKNGSPEKTSVRVSRTGRVLKRRVILDISHPKRTKRDSLDSPTLPVVNATSEKKKPRDDSGFCSGNSRSSFCSADENREAEKPSSKDVRIVVEDLFLYENAKKGHTPTHNRDVSDDEIEIISHKPPPVPIQRNPIRIFKTPLALCMNNTNFTPRFRPFPNLPSTSSIHRRPIQRPSSTPRLQFVNTFRITPRLDPEQLRIQREPREPAQ